MHTLLFQTFLAMGCRILGVSGGPVPHLQPMPILHLICAFVLCFSPGTTMKVFVPEKHCPPPHGPWLQHILSLLTVCNYQQPLVGSTATWPWVFETSTEPSWALQTLSHSAKCTGTSAFLHHQSPLWQHSSKSTAETQILTDPPPQVHPGPSGRRNYLILKEITLSKIGKFFMCCWEITQRSRVGSSHPWTQ